MFCLQHTIRIISNECSNGIQFLALAGNHSLGNHSLCIELIHHSSQNRRIHAFAQAQNGFQADDTVGAFHNGLLHCQVHRNRLCSISVLCCVAQPLGEGHCFISIDLRQRNIHHGITQQTPDHTLITVFIHNDRLEEAVADNGIGDWIVISIHQALNEARLRIVELCVLVNLVIGHLHIGGQQCDELIDGIHHRLHQITDGGTFKALRLFLVTKGVHHGDQHDLHIGVHLQNGVHSTGIVHAQRNRNIDCKIGQIGIGQFLLQHRLHALDHSHQTQLHFRLTLTQNVLIVVVEVGLRIGKADDFQNTAKAKHANITIANGQRNNIGLSNLILEILGNHRHLFCSGDAVGCIEGLGQLRHLGCRIAAILASLTALAVNVSKGSIGTSMVTDFVQCPEIAAAKSLIPLFLPAIFIPPGSILLVLRDHLGQQGNRLRVVIIQFQQPMDVFSTNTGHCQLGVIHLGHTIQLLQQSRKLVGISLVSIVFHTGIVVIALQAIAVGHRIANRHIMNGLFICFRISRCKCTDRQHRDYHCQHQQHR